MPASIRVATLDVPDLAFSRPVRVFALRLRRPTHDVIPGRSFLQRYVVTFDGPRGVMIFDEPNARLEEQLDG